jgi:hypothetical protein
MGRLLRTQYTLVHPGDGIFQIVDSESVDRDAPPQGDIRPGSHIGTGVC